MMPGKFIVDRIDLQPDARFEAFWIRVQQMPLIATERIALHATLQRLEKKIISGIKHPLMYEVYIQTSQLQRPEGPLLLSRNGPVWLPSPGVGVWPDKAPPRSMNASDFEKLIPGKEMPLTSHQLLRLNTRSEEVRLEAVRSMCGTGALLSMLIPEDWNAARRRISAELEKRMQEESFRGHPFYAPLLDEVSLRTLPAADLAKCLDGVLLYSREDKTEQAVLVISSTPVLTSI